MTDISKWASMVGNVGRHQYTDRLSALKARGIKTDSIEKAVKDTVSSVSHGDNVSFVIFGEPQSGKTEMMIALNAKLLDDGCEVIINLLTDSVDLLKQSLSRFRMAGLSPSPKQFSELPSEAKDIKGKQWLIFSKKNARDLEKLKDSIRFVDKVVVIDDEADYASPNAKINSGDKTRINRLIQEIIKGRGQYIGVTATPARLDLNNTFDNKTERWVDFEPHAEYVGQDFFFPQNGKVSYRLKQFDADEGDERLQLRSAILHFLCGVAEQHQLGLAENFTMIVHTSGKTSEHREDFTIVEETLGILANPKHRKFGPAVKQLLKIAPDFNKKDPESIVEFVLKNINKNQIVEINSKRKNDNISDILTPKSLFSFGVGGNIISRGVTFDNLLSMYFTRGVKGKFTQDTYIQRARMFGSRGKYKNSFQLWVPKALLENWTKCFAFHKLAVEAAKSGMGAPVWLSDHKTAPTASSSIDRSSVDFEDGEMSFGLFDFDQNRKYMGDPKGKDLERLAALRKAVPVGIFPDYVYKYLINQHDKEGAICFHDASAFGVRSSYPQSEIDAVRRSKGIFSTNEFSRGGRPGARHHLKMYFNAKGKARLFYKINGKTIRFIQNRK